MNDRFKFRVWDNEQKRYTSVKPVVLCGEASTLEIAMPDNSDGQYVIEQCTGLRDKNGRLIYEGDICLLYKTKCEIRWKDGGFGARDYPPCADADGCIFSDTVPFTNRRYLKEILNAIDVVGTIHDNPDDGWPVTPQGKPLPKGIKTWEW